MTQPHPSKIDYLEHAGRLIGRPGRVLNIGTGCRHLEMGVCQVPCYAKRIVETRLKDNPAYPYGFEPTFHPERVRAYGGKPKLIFLNDMGDVGGDWMWRFVRENATQPPNGLTPKRIAEIMVRFALLNPEHILLLLTKRPEWYGLVEWPDNVWCGFTATDNHELIQRSCQLGSAGISERYWVSAEPWLDDEPPYANGDIKDDSWIVIGGQSKPDRPVSEATLEWLLTDKVGTMRFTKRNAYVGTGCEPTDFPYDYPAGWRVGGAK